MDSLKDRGIKRIIKAPIADIEICKIYNPKAVCALGVIAAEYGFNTHSLFLPSMTPDWIVSGYRDEWVMGGAKNSPHFWGDAFDIKVGDILKQYQFVRLAVETLGLFNRCGLYVGKNTCHIDQRDEEWMQKYNGSKCWVWHKNKYYPFASLHEANRFALKVSTPGD